ncbi:serine hydrolase [Candidatus Saccharibacteria bacterium]|nr:MAG: serine hydrolase [Candidatus Saccharibacteria bacterium]
MHKLKARAVALLARVDWKKYGTYIGLSTVAVLLLVQLFYPTDRLLPFTRIDSVAVGGMTKAEATAKINSAYKQYKADIYMGVDTKPFVSPKLADIDVVVDNTARIKALDYPFIVRLIPTSLFWAGAKQSVVPAPVFGSKFEVFVDASLMKECTKQPVNATLKATGESLDVVPAVPGGQCDRTDVLTALKKMQPKVGTATVVKVGQKVIQPAITDVAAQALAKALNVRLARGIQLQVGDSQQTLPAGDVMSWLDFIVDGTELAPTVNTDRAGAYLSSNIAPKVAVKPGVSYITTVDFTETSRVNGTNGQALDSVKTAKSIEAVVDGSAQTAIALTTMVPPTEQYTRSYSPTDAGLSALLANYAKDHSGTFGISLVELDGKKRRASSDGDKKFVTASTYKLFVAYSVLKRIDEGTRSWDTDGACFNKMISNSDNACAESLQTSLGGGSISKGASLITKDIKAIGLSNSNFTEAGGPFTTANDLALLLGMLQSGQNFSPTNRERLINAMLANVYRKGIPAGASGSVADKVGFMDGLLHDAAIVYSPSGTYVLVVMTSGSSWATIADLASQIDTLRAK